MTGPEHYRASEEILDSIEKSPDNHLDHRFRTAAEASETRDWMILAQIHATLALAAATAMAAYDTLPEGDCEAWDQVAGVQDDEHDDDVIPADVYAERVDDEHFVEYVGEGSGFTATLKRFDGAEPEAVREMRIALGKADDDIRSRLTPAQLDGTACAHCGREFADDQPTEPAGSCDGRQLLAHIDICNEVA